MASHLQDRVVVITGAGGGFGRLVAQKSAARGARVVACDVDEASLKETVGSIYLQSSASPCKSLRIWPT